MLEALGGRLRRGGGGGGEEEEGEEDDEIGDTGSSRGGEGGMGAVDEL